MAVVQRSGAFRDATATFQHNQWMSNVAALEQVRTSHKKHQKTQLSYVHKFQDSDYPANCEGSAPGGYLLSIAPALSHSETITRQFQNNGIQSYSMGIHRICVLHLPRLLCNWNLPNLGLVKHLFGWYGNSPPSPRSLHSTCPNYGSPEAFRSNAFLVGKVWPTKVWKPNSHINQL